MDWQVEGAGGTILRGRRWDVEAPRGAVYLAHGLAEHIERYDRFARALNAAGLAVAGHDHRGHGRTAASENDLGHFADRDGFDLMAGDLAAGMRAWRTEQPDLPLILFGHSMGSFLVQQLMADAGAGFDMAILSGSNGPPPPLAAAGRLIARIERLRLGRRGRSNLIHALAFDANNKPFEPAPTKVEWLSRDRAEVDAYVADPLCGFVSTTASWIALLDALPGLTSAASVARIAFDLPVLLASGDRDPVGGMGDGVQRLHDIYAEHGVGDLTLRLYDGARHEILNETNRDDVTADICGWIDERLPSR
ncbi:alpha/beta fold hydrolase [Minwuia sp.]|uniref:alpha/beta fold hydrolase n=1 Tax=Minwuia sp. TaxID=2493630 RepID=UPI003A8D37A0